MRRIGAHGRRLVFLCALLLAASSATALSAGGPGKWSTTGPLNVPRALGAAMTLVNGKVLATTLGRVQSADWVSGKWIRVTIDGNGNNLRAQVFRLDTAQYLTSTGQWQATPGWALNLTDGTLSLAGQVGLSRPASYAGTITFDDFSVNPTTGPSQPPTVTITAPTAGAVLSGVTRIQATATDALGVDRVEFYVDGVLRAASSAARRLRHSHRHARLLEYRELRHPHG